LNSKLLGRLTMIMSLNFLVISGEAENAMAY
jgi:hypothetical protein